MKNDIVNQEEATAYGYETKKLSNNDLRKYLYRNGQLKHCVKIGWCPNQL